MNWRRGFFRLWVFVAVLWVGVATWIFYQSLTTEPYFAQVYLAIPNGKDVLSYSSYSSAGRTIEKLKEEGKVTFVTDDNFPEATFLRGAKDDEKTATLDLVKMRVFQEEQREAKRQERRGNAYSDMLYLGILPPIVFLVIGTAIAWVLGGFRRSA